MVTLRSIWPQRSQRSELSILWQYDGSDDSDGDDDHDDDDAKPQTQHPKPKLP